MDWKTWLAVGLSIVGLVLWQVFYSSKVSEQQRQVEAQRQEQAIAQAAEGEKKAATEVSREDVVSAAAPKAPPALEASDTFGGTFFEPDVELVKRKEVLKNDYAEFVFQNDSGGIQVVNLLRHLAEGDEKVSLNKGSLMPIGALGMENERVLGGFKMKVDGARQRVIFERMDSDGMRISKVFQLATGEDGKVEGRQYVVELQVVFENTSAAPLQRLGYFIATGMGAPVHRDDQPRYTRFDWYREGKMKSIDPNWFSASRIPILGIETRGDRPLYAEASEATFWAAATSQYFATIVRSAESNSQGVWARRYQVRGDPGHPVYAIFGGILRGGFSVAPGEKHVENFEIFTGPKNLEMLRKLGHGEDSVMSFGMFGIVSEVLLWGMNRLHDLTGNYAAAIILLTLIIKSVLWPLQDRATQSMRRMSILSPKMTELREKYKDNPQKMNEELMKLYREYGVNPFGGCLPMLIQIPIFFGFYSMLGVAIQLRNASFLWIHDLSQPDTVGHLFGIPINLLPLIMAATMLIQMMITPKTGDSMQQRMFYFMPVIFLLFCYNFASALALYWTTQNIFSIVQLYLTRNRPLPKLERKTPSKKGKRPKKK
ncbi:MAG: membrane protein insertase YidC [Chthoniobacterales bacterium]